MLNTIAFLGVLSLLIIVHEWGHFITARRSGVRVLRFSVGFGPIVWRLLRGGTEYALSAIPLGGYVKMAGEAPEEGRRGEPDEFFAQPVGVRTRIVAAGPILNYALAFAAFILVFWLGNPTLQPVVGQVMAGTPAQQVGLLAGDRILTIDGQAMRSWDQLTKIIRRTTSGSVTLRLERQGRVFNQAITPEVKERRDLFGHFRRAGQIGVAPAGEVRLIRVPLPAAVGLAAGHVVELTWLTLQSLWSLLTGGVSVRESLTGPIGIFFITGEAARMGVLYLLQIVGVLSLSLGLFNFLPIPVLDGGHLFFLLCERLRGRPVNVRVQERAMQAGLAVLMLLMVLVCYTDVARFGLVDKVADWLRR